MINTVSDTGVAQVHLSRHFSRATRKIEIPLMRPYLFICKHALRLDRSCAFSARLHRVPTFLPFHAKTGHIVVSSKGRNSQRKRSFFNCLSTKNPGYRSRVGISLAISLIAQSHGKLRGMAGSRVLIRHFFRGFEGFLNLTERRSREKPEMTDRLHPIAALLWLALFWPFVHDQSQRIDFSRSDSLDDAQIVALTEDLRSRNLIYERLLVISISRIQIFLHFLPRTA
jgi:hypothetical protein